MSAHVRRNYVQYEAKWKWERKRAGDFRPAQVGLPHGTGRRIGQERHPAGDRGLMIAGQILPHRQEIACARIATVDADRAVLDVEGEALPRVEGGVVLDEEPLDVRRRQPLPGEAGGGSVPRGVRGGGGESVIPYRSGVQPCRVMRAGVGISAGRNCEGLPSSGTGGPPRMRPPAGG